MDFSISDLLLYFSIVTLQFGDWWTTKVFVAREGVEAEANPIGRNGIKRDGGVRHKLLAQKLFLGVIAVYPIVLFPDIADVMIGIFFWAMVRVVLNNTCIIFSSYCMNYMKIHYKPMKDLMPDELAEIAVRSAFREMTLGLFLAFLGIWIYSETGRTFLFGAALINLIIMCMELLTACEYKNKALLNLKTAP